MFFFSTAYKIVVFSNVMNEISIFLHNEFLFDLKHELDFDFEYVVDVNFLIHFVVVVVDRISMQRRFVISVNHNSNM